jgi:transposase
MADDPRQTPEPTPVPFEDLTGYLGFDWAKAKHQVVMVDRQGAILLDLEFAETAEGWADFRRKMAALAPPAQIGAAVETRCGPAVERLLEAGVTVFPLNPKAAQRYRDRKAPSGVKTDRMDAWSMADGLRTDGHGWRPLRPQDPATQELRLLCRDEIGLIEQRTALVNALQAALYEYYPAALEAFDDWTKPFAWDFVIAFPTPQALARAGKRKWQNFLHAHKLYRKDMAEKRQEIFARATAFANPNAAVTAAKSLLAVTLAKQLRTLETQLTAYRRRIETLFADHPDGDLFGSLPGAGPKLAPRLLAEIGANRDEFDSHSGLTCYGGAAPVSFQSGKVRKARIRRACNKPLRATLHLWMEQAIQRSVWSATYYQKKRAEGKSHASALRCLAQRWLKILWTMWQERKPYDEARHTANQVAHGSWVLSLLPTSEPAPSNPQPA